MFKGVAISYGLLKIVLLLRVKLPASSKIARGNDQLSGCRPVS